MHINAAHGERQEDFSHTVALPLPQNFTLFELQKPEPVKRSGEITKTEETRLTPTFELLAACYCADMRGLPQARLCFVVTPECLYEYRLPRF
ncbi:hypothetical protein [Oscillibacter sp.]|uniref:hypothetical protein n=1 Tax=Oscillibacter sp. TaxID=1945593 RepID=UPI0028A00346|nr:hypothetical protein [Oscillibacter sp.]